VIITGGYRGLMERICGLAEEIKDKHNKNEAAIKKKTSKGGVGREYRLNILGILFDGYANDPQNSDPTYIINSPNPFNHFCISTASIGERAQNLVQLSDIVIALPGGSGTLHEILHCIEHIKYGMNYENDTNFKRLILHNYWNEGKLKHLSENNLLNKGIFDQLVFWSQLKIPALFEALDKIKEFNKEDVSRFIPYENTDFNLSIIDLDSGQQLPANSEYISFIKDLNTHLQSSYYKDKNHVVGLDIVIVDTGREEIVKLITLGIQKYLKVLEAFLKDNSSILSNISYLKENLSRFECSDLTNIGFEVEANQLFKLDFTEESKKSTTGHTRSAEFRDWQAYLQDNKLGKNVVWITLPALGNRYVVSAFVSFNIFVPELSKPHIRSMLTAFLYNQTLTELHERLTEDLKNQATKAAISQVMARNMSHNIGSHVLSKFKDKSDMLNVSSLATSHIIVKNIRSLISR
jgi:predicted Rossmann-fold nucleotide-binding protein